MKTLLFYINWAAQCLMVAVGVLAVVGAVVDAAKAAIDGRW